MDTRTDLSEERTDQVCRLLDAGVPGLAGVAHAQVEEWAQALPDVPHTVLALHPDLVPAAALALLMRRGEQPGFVVEDLGDLHEFVPQGELPSTPLYLLEDVATGRRPPGLEPGGGSRRARTSRPAAADRARGDQLLLQAPEQLVPGSCFMTVASRRPTGAGTFDALTPAIWISGGTGRDGKERRGAPKVGWGWWRNRHTWLGFASTARRIGPSAQ